MIRWILTVIAITLGLSGCSPLGGGGNTSYVYQPLIQQLGSARFGSFDLRLYLQNNARFDNPQGVALASNPHGDGLIFYGVNSGQNRIIYNVPEFSFRFFGRRRYNSLQIYSKNQETNDHLQSPWGIATDSNGVVYVVDRGHARIVRLTPNALDRNLEFDRYLGEPGNEPGQFIDPKGIAIVRDDVIAVADAGLGRVTILNANGDLLNYWEDLDEPVSIASTYGTEKYNQNDNYIDFLVVVDSLTRRVTSFDYAGQLIARTDAMSWNAPLTPDLDYVAIDRYHQILITDRNNNCIHKLKADHEYLTRFGDDKNGSIHFDEPRGIAIDPKSGKVVVLERDEMKTVIVGVDVPRYKAEIVADSIWRDLHIDFFLTEPAMVSIDLLSEYNQFIARIVERRVYKAGQKHIAWGLTVPDRMPDGSPLTALPPNCHPGQRLPEGRYILKANFRATYGSEDFFSVTKSTSFRLYW